MVHFWYCENPWLSFVDDHRNKGPKDVGNGFLESLDQANKVNEAKKVRSLHKRSLKTFQEIYK